MKLGNHNVVKLDTYISRSNIENFLERISKRAILNELKLLQTQKRVKIAGQSSQTAYKISNAYYEEYSELLYIYQNQILVGYLGFDYQTYYFVYDTNYLISGKYIAKFQMPFSLETFVLESCFVDFEECLPEGIDRKILIDKVGNATEFFLLAHNDYSKNDLIFSSKSLIFAQKLKPQSYLVNKEKILGKNKFPNILKYTVDIDDVSLFPTLHMNETEELKHVRTMSLSGYQHKLQVVFDGDTIRTPKNGEDANFFIKPYDPIKADENSEYYFPHLTINGKQTNIRYNDFLKLASKAKVDKNDFKESAVKILSTYMQKMPTYIKKISKLENREFFIKEKPNAQDKKVKIKSQTTLDVVMMKHYENRCETLKQNGWFEKLGI